MRKLKNILHFLIAYLANFIYLFPSKNMTVIGITGTDGKTTTAYFTYQLLKNAGFKVGLISTVGAFIDNKKIDIGLHVTNPNSLSLQKIISYMKSKKIEIVIIEVTSHGIDQHRVSGIKFDIAALTNISPEHLDYHHNFENYVSTKEKLFINASRIILNIDDKSGKSFLKKYKNKAITYSSKLKSDFKFDLKDKNNLIINNDDKNIKLPFNIQGIYNAYNFVAAVAIARALDIDWKSIKSLSKKVELPEGRFNEIKNTKNLKIYVDFAHTPNAVAKVLDLLKKESRGKLIVVHGTAGERDFIKRKDMGKSSSIADLSIFTAEDPRSENVSDIINQMIKGSTNEYKIIEDRGTAIYKAINKYAKKKDTVVILGKGHEKSMNFSGVEYPWSDKKAVEYALKGKILKIKK